MKRDYISDKVIKRLPKYLRCLDTLIAEGTERISSTDLGRKMSLTPSQIRQDFSCFGEFGQQGYGYNVKVLRSEIAAILGMDRNYSAILVGSGRLGQTLIENFDFKKYGFRFIGAFDINRDIIGHKVANVTIMDAAYQAEFIRLNKVDVAILSVQRRNAQAVANELIEAGVRAIWNFTDSRIEAGDSGVRIENIYFADSLLTLSYHLSQEDNE